MLLRAASMTIGRSLGYYTGIFSTAVTASVNPTATMAALSALGAIENASLYSPESAFFNTIADSLNSIPVLNAAADLPIANPYAAVFLTLVAAVMIVLHSFAESKIVSQATIDKLDKLTGWIGVTALSLMPLLTNENFEKTARSGKNASHIAETVSAGAVNVTNAAPWYVWIIGIFTLIIASIVYSICYDCVDNIGTICAAVPVKGLNIVEQIIKALIHAGMILLQITFPAISFIVSILVAIAGILLFNVLRRITFYYKEVYIRPVLHRIFRKDKEISRIHKKTPGKIRKRYPGLDLSVPMFVFRGIPKFKTRQAVWFITTDNGGSALIRRKAFGRIEEIAADEIKNNYPGVELIEYRRFYSLRTTDKKFNIVISKSYREFAEIISRSFNVPFTPADNSEKAVSLPET